MGPLRRHDAREPEPRTGRTIAAPLRAEKARPRVSKRLNDTFLNAPIGILLIDFDGTVLEANPFAEDMLGYAPSALERVLLESLVPREAAITLISDLKTVIRQGGRVCRSEWQLTARDGSEVWANLHLMVHRSEHDAPLFGIVLLADITETKNSQRAMERLAFYDTLTDLGNRRLFNERLRQTVERSRRDQSRAALLYLDLDQFKRVNDTLGHDSGDRLLCEVAARLASCVRSVDTVARTGGDEFCLLLEDIASPQAAAEVAGRIFEALKQPIKLGHHEIGVTTSIGITLIPDDGTDPNQLLKNADLAMYRAKEQGRNNHQYYSESLQAHLAHRLRVEQELRRALARNEFSMVYQPVVETATGRVIGFESLLRWGHPELGTLTPGDFITIAEESGIIIDMGRWILQQVCADAVTLLQQARRPLSMGINVSPRQFRDASLVFELEQAIAQTGLDPRHLEFEITETMLMHDIETTSAMVHRLAALGARIAIDDFGTGYSSLNYLRKFPITAIKIDHSFIRDIPANGDDSAITAAVIAMAHRLHVTVVAEGVETTAQQRFLVAQGCDFAQGYLFGRPMSLAAACAAITPDVPVSAPTLSGAILAAAASVG